MLTVKQAWTSTGGTSGPLAVISLQESENFTQGVVYLNHSTLATTQSFNFESAQESTGPWLIETSTVLSSVANVSTNMSMRLTGPIGPFIRPRLLTPATGFYNVLLLGVAP